MDWSKGFSASYYMKIVDPVTWRDLERVEIKGGSINRERDGLMHSADIDCRDFGNKETYVRIYLDVRQGDDGAHVPLFTGLATTPDDEYTGVVKSNTLQCYSVLKAADDVLLPRGWYAPAGISAAVILKQLLSATPAPVTIAEDAPTLTSSIVADEDDSYLDMAQHIVEAINWHIRLNGAGEVIIEPLPTDAVMTFDPFENDCIETEITVTHDWYNCPNVFRAIDEDLTAVARDDSASSELSTVSRGREIWAQDTSCDLGDNESIEEYSLRRLKEEQQRAVTGSYKRRFYPDILPGDLVYLKYPKQGLNGLYRVQNQSIDLGYGAATSEEVSNE